MSDAKTFIEFGCGHGPEMGYLLSPNWRYFPENKLVGTGDRWYEDRLCDALWYVDEWFGLLVEPHPFNIITMHNNLIKEKRENCYMIPGVVASPEREGLVRFGIHQGKDLREIDFACSIVRFREEFPSLYFFTISLDTLVSYAPHPVELMRIDCEGAEVEILETYSFSVKPTQIILECHDYITPNATDRCYEILDAQGYSIQGYDWHTDGGLNYGGKYLIGVLT